MVVIKEFFYLIGGGEKVQSVFMMYNLTNIGQRRRGRAV